MKTMIKLMLLAWTLILASCDDSYHCGLTTTINDDGSITREYTLHLDSTQLLTGKPDNASNMVQLGRGWKLEWALKESTQRQPLPMDRTTFNRLQEQCRKDSRKVSDTIVVYARKTFPTAEEASRETHFKVVTRDLNPILSVEKSTGLFHTEYRFTETFPKQDIKYPVPLRKFFTDDEIGFWFKGSPNLVQGLSGIEMDDVIDNIKEKYEDWMLANMFELYYQAIVDHYDQASAGAMDKQQFLALHDSLLTQCLKSEADMKSFELQGSDWFKAQLHSTAYNKILDNEEIMKAPTELILLSGALSKMNIDYQVFMPYSDKPQLTTHMNGFKLLVDKVQYKATITHSHPWAYIVLAVLLVLSLTGLVFFRKKNR